MRKIGAIMTALWVFAILGLALSAHDKLWQLIKSHGLGGHPEGIIFALFPLGLLAAEWIVAVGVPIFAVIIAFRSMHAESD